MIVRLDTVHEVALSEQVAAVARRAAGGRRVHSVRLRIGALRQVVPEPLAYAWEFTTAGTSLDGATLDVEWVPGRLRCPAGHESLMQGEFDVHCPRCGEVARIIGGEEFTVVDLSVSDSSGSPDSTGRPAPEEDA
nr:hydrogenase maturation nickel metallochaperone HypA [Corynebacterium uropygiale]